MSSSLSSSARAFLSRFSADAPESAASRFRTPSLGEEADESAASSRRRSHNNSTLATASFLALIEGRGKDRGELGLAYVAMNSPTLILSQFSDTRTYIRAIAKLYHLDPSEILIPSTGYADPQCVSKLYNDLSASCPRATIVQVPHKFFNESKGLTVLQHLVSPDYQTVELQLRHKSFCLAAAHALLKYVEESENLIYALRSLRIEYQASENCTFVDMETIRFSELLPTEFNERNSLLNVFDKCYTPGGMRLLRGSLYQPPLRLNLIEARQEAVSELLSNPGLFRSLQSIISRFCDLDQLLSLCVFLPRKENLSNFEQRLNHVIGLKHALELVNPLASTLECASSSLLSCIFQVVQEPVYELVLQQVQAVLSENARVQKGSGAMQLQRCFALKSGINAMLDVARRTYCEVVDDIELLVGQLSDYHGLPMRVGFSASKGYHVQIPVGKRGGCSELSISQLPAHFLNAQRARNMITFTTEDIIKANVRTQDALREIVTLSNAVLLELLETLRESIGCIYRLSENVSALDMLLILAQLAERDPESYTRPQFVQEPTLVIKNGKHPLILEKAVPNDTTLSAESSVHVVTGCNMSGKSTYLKQVVLLQIMAQIGSFIPAESAIVSVRDGIFSRLHNGDSLECNASSFALEMKQMAYIMNNAGPNSLVVLDELGRSTTLEEGAAICWSMMEELIKKRTLTILATHFVLLTKLEQLYPTVLNFAMVSEERVDAQNRTLIGQTHKLVQGSCQSIDSNRNYGIALARASSMPEQVVNLATKLAKSLNHYKLVIPEMDPEGRRLSNAVRLIRHLKEVAAFDHSNEDEMVNSLQRLQVMFAGTEDEGEGGEYDKMRPED